MSWKTLTEEFTKAEESMTSPFEFESNITVLAVPEKMMPEISAGAEKPEGTTLNMPNVPKTKTVEVVEAPETFKGELGHLTPEEHATVIAWFEKMGKQNDVPTEVATYLLDIAMRLKLDAKKRIIPTEINGQEQGVNNGQE